MIEGERLPLARPRQVVTLQHERHRPVVHELDVHVLPKSPGGHGDLIDGRLERATNRAGGLEGGVTNGADLVVRAFLKPISTLRRGLPSVDLATGEPGATVWERSDVTAIGAAPVIVEAMLALILADALLEKLGGDAIVDTDNAWKALVNRLAPWWRPTELPTL